MIDRTSIATLFAAAGFPVSPWLIVPVVVALVLLCLLAAFMKTPLFKGWFGELAVNLALKLYLSKKRYHLLQNVTIPTEDGTTQIDHIVVSRYGIFVIETKDYRGWIFGHPDEPKWTQKFPGSSRQFQNPLRQNYKHVRALAEQLGLPDGSFKPVIYFCGDAVLKTPMPDNVLKGGLAGYIKRHTQEILSEAQVHTALERIAATRLAPSLTTHAKHVQHVRQIVADKEKSRGK